MATCMGVLKVNGLASFLPCGYTLHSRSLIMHNISRDSSVLQSPLSFKTMNKVLFTAKVPQPAEVHTQIKYFGVQIPLLQWSDLSLQSV